MNLNIRKNQLVNKVIKLEENITQNLADSGEVLKMMLTKAKLKARIEELEFLLGDKEKDIIV